MFTLVPVCQLNITCQVLEQYKQFNQQTFIFKFFHVATLIIVMKMFDKLLCPPRDCHENRITDGF